MRPAEKAPRIVTQNARYGLILFAIYVVLYGGFILLAVFKPDVMAAPLFGLNVAITYGLGLIGSALVLALVYMALCVSPTSHEEGRHVR